MKKSTLVFIYANHIFLFMIRFSESWTYWNFRIKITLDDSLFMWDGERKNQAGRNDKGGEFFISMFYF